MHGVHAHPMNVATTNEVRPLLCETMKRRVVTRPSSLDWHHGLGVMVKFPALPEHKFFLIHYSHHEQQQ